MRDVSGDLNRYRTHLGQLASRIEKHGLGGVLSDLRKGLLEPDVPVQASPRRHWTIELFASGLAAIRDHLSGAAKRDAEAVRAATAVVEQATEPKDDLGRLKQFATAAKGFEALGLVLGDRVQEHFRPAIEARVRELRAKIADDCLGLEELARSLTQKFDAESPFGPIVDQLYILARQLRHAFPEGRVSREVITDAKATVRKLVDLLAALEPEHRDWKRREIVADLQGKIETLHDFAVVYPHARLTDGV